MGLESPETPQPRLRVWRDGEAGALRRPRREVAAQRVAQFARRARSVPPADARAGTSQRDVPTTLNTYSKSFGAARGPNISRAASPNLRGFLPCRFRRKTIFLVRPRK